MEIVGAGDKVFVLGCTDARGGASGVSLKQPIAYVYEFENGMARRVRSYIDPDRTLAAVGLPPADVRASSAILANMRSYEIPHASGRCST